MAMEKLSSNFWITTSCTPEYVKGVVALKNSLLINFPKAKLAIFSYAKKTELTQQLIDLFPEDTIIPEAPMRGPLIDEGKLREGLPLGPDMYSRLVMPEYFNGRIFYVDADCIVLKDLSELWEMDLQGFPSGCVYRPDIGWIGGHVHDDMASGTILIDCDKWESEEITKNCFEVMKIHQSGNLNRRFHVNVESVLSFVHNGQFLHLPAEYQHLTYYGELSTQDKVAHFAGQKPWFNKKSNEPLNYVPLWNAYYAGNADLIKNETEKLIDVPLKKWDRRKV
jgi:UDP-glucose/galactose:(glucosyl)LPS alpha-1,2-glucosyl/galactosyltransferase